MTIKDKLLTKLCKGTCSREELQFLLDLLHEEQDDTDVLAKLWKELRSYPEMEEGMASQMMRNLMARVDEKESILAREKTDRRPSKGNQSNRRRFVQFARAAVILILVSTVSWFWIGTEKRVVVQTTFAAQKTIELPDHSTVKMNANSKISYYRNWTSVQTRQVWLEGEAYFDVQKKPESGQKFQVITPDLTIEVLGTTFNVNARETSTKVFLEEGQIRLDIEEQAEYILMEPGELVTYSKSLGKPLRKLAESEAPASWKNGTIVMEDAMLNEIIQKIHEIYDVKVIVENQAYLEREFTVFLPVDDPGMGYNTLSGLGLEIIKLDNHWTIE